MPPRNGFTLIELMIVVVVVGVLASIAIPKYLGLARTARQAEVEPLLRQIYTLEERYKAKYGSYTYVLDQLEGGPTLGESGKYFDFGVQARGDAGLCIVADPNEDGVEAGLEPRAMDEARNFYDTAGC